MKEFIIGKNDAGKRLDSFLTKVIPTLPVSLMYKSIRTKKIKVNRKRAELSYKLVQGDSVQCFLSEEFFTDEKKPDMLFTSLQGNVNIIYEDENILLADKKAGVLTHSGDGTSEPTLIDEIKAYLFKKGEYEPENELFFAPALCNRIDRNTAGIVIAAKNAEALRIMNEMIKQHKVDKYYLCAVHGKMEKTHGILTAYLFKDSTKGRAFVYDNAGKGRTKIVTEYTVKQYKNGLSLLEIHLITGKTHQIRAHFSHIGHPLLGEGKYGINRQDKKLGYSHQALYSYKLKFNFGSDGGILSYLSGKEFTVDEKNIYFLEEFGI